ncbi:hypothetical protein BGX20_001595 [Mortierella sp. AD010]|nr:hypothetical protein BGX20_001595 [Mortierella sp. AD010]
MATACQIKITFQQDGRKQSRIIDFDPSITCRLAVEQYNYSRYYGNRYSRKHGGWIHDETRIMDIIFKGTKSLELRTKSPSYFETRPSATLEPSKSSLRDSALLRGPTSPIDHYRLFNLFRSTDEQFVSKFQNGSIYLSLIVLNSDNKILLSPSGLPPTVLISTVGGLANYYNFDSDSSDFAWMFKTTLDWASDPSSNRDLRDERSRAASPEPRPPVLSPPASRSSFSSRSKRGSISSTTCPSPSNGAIVNGVNSAIVNQTSRLTSSSISFDRASIVSDTSRQPSIYDYVDRRGDYRGENSLRQEYVAAAEEIQQKLGCPPIELLFDRVVDLPLVGAKTVMAIQYARDYTKDHIAPELMQLGSFRWRHIDSVSNSVYTRKEEVWSQLTNYYDSVRVSRISPGLYIGLYYTESTMSGLQILVPKHRRTFIPIVKLRDQTSLSLEEWSWIRSTTTMGSDEFAKNCTISKDDPMHHLKVEFARSTAQLSQLTQLKWNPSDIYALDTLQVVMQDRKDLFSQPVSRRMSQDSQIQIPMAPDEQSKPGSMTTMTPPQQSMTAMDLNPIWKSNAIDQDSSKTFRVIMFVKPTRHATQAQENYNKQVFELCPFPIFDALHHSIYNTGTYHQLRRSMLKLTNSIIDLELEMEQEIEQELIQLQRDKELAGTQDSDFGRDGDKIDDDPSCLIDSLDIKGESPLARSNHPHQHPRHRSSFIGDDAIHGSSFSKRLSLSSLREPFNKGVPPNASVVSFAPPFSPRIDSTSVGPLSLSAAGSRLSVIGIDVGGEFNLPFGKKGRRDSHTSQDPLQMDENGDHEESAIPSMELMQDLNHATNGAIMNINLKNASSFSVDSISSFVSSNSSSSEDDDDDTTRDSYRNRKEYSLRRSSLGNQCPNCPNILPPLPSLPRHRRSYSLIQAVDLRMAEINGFNGIRPAFSANVTGLKNSTGRSRTASCSSYIHSHHQYQKPIYRNRYLSGNNYPHYISHIQQHQHNQDQQQPNDIYSTNDNNDSDGQYPAELARLERQQQELQEQWRMVSWTRQLNEWDHARMVESQSELLGIGMGVGMSMGIELDMNMDMDMVTSNAISNAAILQQNIGIPSPPNSDSFSSLQSAQTAEV